MNRALPPAALLALIVHGALLLGPGRWFATKEQQPELTFRSVSVTLEQLPPLKPEVPPVEEAMATEPEPETPEEPVEPVNDIESPAEEIPSEATPEPVKEIEPEEEAPPVEQPATPTVQKIKVPEKPPKPITKPKPSKPVKPVERPDQHQAPVPSTRTPTTRHAEAAPVIRKAYPLYKENPPPAYPRLARRRGWQGTVRLDVLVKETGRVSEARVAVSSNHKILDQAALEAVKTWRFEPGRKGDEPIAMWIRVPIRYNLR